MTDHADTIRRIAERKPEGIVIADVPYEGYDDRVLLTVEERDLLVAERKQAIDALRRIEQLLVDDGYALDDARAIARAALLSLGEQPK